MRHPSLSIIPSLPGIMRVTAMLLPFCWSPFGWSATLPADLN